MSHYSEEQLLYFLDTAFGYPDKVKKWNKKIVVTIVGSCSDVDRLDVQNVVQELSGVLGEDKIDLGSDQANLFIYFVNSQREFEKEKNGVMSADVDGFVLPTFSFLDQVNQVRLYISPSLNGRSRSKVLRHEFCHALGLWGHSRRQYREEHLLGVYVYGSIDDYEEENLKPVVIPEADLMAIRLLYYNSIPIGLKKSAFQQYLKKSRQQL